ncbi:hypothetical protein ACNUI5_09140 [Pseudomonas aeruginosa]
MNVAGSLTMGRKSSIDKVPPDVRSFIERSLRENRLTLDELIEQLPSASPGQGRRQPFSDRPIQGQGFDEITRRLREQQSDGQPAGGRARREPRRTCRRAPAVNPSPP